MADSSLEGKNRLKQSKLRQRALKVSRTIRRPSLKKPPTEKEHPSYLDNEYYQNFVGDIFRVRPVDELLKDTRVTALKSRLKQTTSPVGETPIQKPQRRQSVPSKLTASHRPPHSAPARRASADLPPIAPSTAEVVPEVLIGAVQPVTDVDTAQVTQESDPSEMPRVRTSQSSGFALKLFSAVSLQGTVEERLNRARLNRAVLEKEQGKEWELRQAEKEESRRKEQLERERATKESVLRLMGLVLVRRFALASHRALEQEKLALHARMMRVITSAAAASKIQLWWRLKCIDALMRQRGDVFAMESSPLRVLMLRFWRRFRVRERRRAADVIKHCVGKKITNFSVRVHQYINKVTRVQRWVRGYMACQDARLQALWLVMERAEKSRLEVLRRTRSEQEKTGGGVKSKRQLLAPSTLEVTMRLDQLLLEQKRKLRIVQRIQRFAAHVGDPRLLAKAVVEPKAHVLHVRSWSQRIAANGGVFLQKLKVLEKVLRQQRRLHIGRYESLESRLSRQKAIPKIGTNEVREFLRDTSGQVHLQMRVESWQKIGLLGTMFLLLTCGGVDEVTRLVNTGILINAAHQ